MFSDLLDCSLFLRLSVPGLSECGAHRGKKLFVVKWFDEKSGGADLHRGSAGREIIASRNDDHARARRNRAHARENFQTGHSFHPDVGHHYRHRMIDGVDQKLLRLIKGACSYIV